MKEAERAVGSYEEHARRVLGRIRTAKAEAMAQLQKMRTYRGFRRQLKKMIANLEQKNLGNFRDAFQELKESTLTLSKEAERVGLRYLSQKPLGLKLKRWVRTRESLYKKTRPNSGRSQAKPATLD